MRPRALLGMLVSVSIGDPAGVAWLAYFVGLGVSTREASLAFYETTAQVIPVLMLVLAVEARLFRVARLAPIPRFPHPTRGPGRRVVVAYARHYARMTAATLTLLALIAGELVAIHPLAKGSAIAGNPRPVVGAIAAALVWITCLALGWEPRIPVWASRPPPEEPDGGDEPPLRPAA